MEEITIDFAGFKEGINDPKATAIINFTQKILGAELWYLNDDKIEIIFERGE